MEVTLSEKTLNALAYKIALILEKRQKSNVQPDFITTAEAASMRGVSPAYMRQLASKRPDLYPHTKTGDSKQSPLLFDRNALLKTLQ